MPTQGCQNVSWDAGRFQQVHRGHILSQSTVCLWIAAVLASLIQGFMNAGWWATQLMHKQLKKIDIRHPSEPWMHMYEINKEETLSCMFYIPTSCRTPSYLEQSVSDLPHQNLLTRTEYRDPCESPFIQSWYYIIRMVMMSWQWCHNCLPFLFGGKCPDACTVESCWLSCTTTGIPNLPHASLPGLLNKIWTPIPTTVTYVVVCKMGKMIWWHILKYDAS